MNSQIYDEASEWLIELQTEQTDTGLRERFQSWLNTSPEHVRAYLELTSLWEDASGIDKRRAFDIDALIASAKAERNIFPLDAVSDRYTEGRATSHGPWSYPNDKHRPRRWMAVAASMAFLGLSAIAGWYWNANLRGVHSTAIGEQRTLALADGTTVELNANTRIRERFTSAERTVELLQGQALFRVARNPQRPFVVSSGNARVRAVGTQFDVNRRALTTTVTVIEGKVAVTPPSLRAASPHPGESYLSAGEQLTLHEGQGAAVPARADIDVATAWTQQRLVFDSANLSDAAEEFNRFNARKLVVDREGLEDFRVSGTFPALDPESLPRFVRFLQDQPGLSITESSDRIHVAKNR